MTTPVTTPRLPIPNGRQLTVRLMQRGQAANVVLGFIDTGTEDPAVVGALALKQFWDKFSGTVIGSTTVAGGTWRDVSQADGTVVELAPYSTAGQTGAGSETIATACVLIKWSTAQGGRSGKGRTFLPGLASADMGVDGRTYGGTLATRVTAAVNGYLNEPTFTSPGLTPAILSFRKGQAYPIIGGSLAPVIGVQRRRMRG